MEKPPNRDDQRPKNAQRDGLGVWPAIGCNGDYLVHRHLERAAFYGLGLRLGQLLSQLGQLLSKTQKLGSQCNLALCPGLWWAAPLMSSQVADTLSSAGDRVALVVEELTNQHGEFDILATVLAMRAASLFGTQCGELGFPVAQRVWLHADDVRDFANLEEQLIRQLGAPCHG